MFDSGINRSIKELNLKINFCPMKTKTNEFKTKKLTRKEALLKAGKYAAFTAAAAVVMLSPKVSQAVSAPRQRGFGY